MAKRKRKVKRKSNAPLIAGLLGLGAITATIADKTSVFGLVPNWNPEGKWFWERIFAPPTQAMTVQQLVAQRNARARARGLRNQRNAHAGIITPTGAGRPIRKSDRTVSKYVVT